MSVSGAGGPTSGGASSTRRGSSSGALPSARGVRPGAGSTSPRARVRAGAVLGSVPPAVFLSFARLGPFLFLLSFLWRWLFSIHHRIWYHSFLCCITCGRSFLNHRFRQSYPCCVWLSLYDICGHGWRRGDRRYRAWSTSWGPGWAAFSVPLHRRSSPR